MRPKALATLVKSTSTSLHTLPPPTPICQRCLRSFATTTSFRAGHNKWSKTKHIKAVTDKKKQSERTSFGKTIATLSRMYGENVDFNPQLANAIAAAAKANVPKHVVENAIAKGQGRSASGAALEQATLEVLLPPNIALMVDIETDNKNRTLNELKYGIIKKIGALVGSTAFYFTKRGRAIFQPKEGGPTLSDMLEEAIEIEGVEDVEELPDGSFLVWAEPPMLMASTEAFSAKFELEVIDCDLVWAPNEDTKVDVDASESVEQLDTLLSGITEYSEVKAISANIRQGTITNDEWERLEKNIDV